MSIREIRERARRQLHERLGEPANYYAAPLAPDPTFEPITVRHFFKPVMAGDLAGTNLSYAETHTEQEQIVFWREEVPEPTRNSLVIINPDEAYFVQTVKPPNGQTVTADVLPAERRDLIGLTAPDGTVISA